MTFKLGISMELQSRDPDFESPDPDFVTRDLNFQTRDPELQSRDPEIKKITRVTRVIFYLGIPTLSRLMHGVAKMLLDKRGGYRCGLHGVGFLQPSVCIEDHHAMHGVSKM